MQDYPRAKTRPNEIQNLKGCHLAVYEERYEYIIHMGNDWNNCQDFVFDNPEQLQQLIDELIKLKERWS